MSPIYFSKALFSYKKDLLDIPLINFKFFHSLLAIPSKPFSHSFSTKFNLSSEYSKFNRKFLAFSDNFLSGLILPFLISDII